MGCGASIEDISSLNGNDNREPAESRLLYHQHQNALIRLMKKNQGSSHINRQQNISSSANDKANNDNRYQFDVYSHRTNLPWRSANDDQENIDQIKQQLENDELNEKHQQQEIPFILQAAVPQLFLRTLPSRTLHRNVPKLNQTKTTDIKNEEKESINNNITSYLDALFLDENGELKSCGEPQSKMSTTMMMTVYVDSRTNSIIKINSTAASASHFVQGPSNFEWEPLKKLSRTKTNSSYFLHQLPLQLQSSISSYLNETTSSFSLENSTRKIRLVSLIPSRPENFESESTTFFDKINSIFEDPRNLAIVPSSRLFPSQNDAINNNNNSAAASSSSSSSSSSIFDFERDLLNHLKRFPSAIFARDHFRGRTCLHTLIDDHFNSNSNQEISRRLDIICQLIKVFAVHGAEIPARDHLGRTVFHLICQKSHLDGAARILQTLIDSCATSIHHERHNNHHRINNKNDQDDELLFMNSIISIMASRDHRGLSPMDHCIQKWRKLFDAKPDDQKQGMLLQKGGGSCPEIRIAIKSIKEVVGKLMKYGGNDKQTERIVNEILGVSYDDSEEGQQHQKKSSSSSNVQMMFFDWTLLHHLIHQNKHRELQTILCDLVKFWNESDHLQLFQNENDDGDNHRQKNVSDVFDKILPNSSKHERRFLLDLLCMNTILSSDSSSSENRKRAFYDRIAEKIFDLFCLSTRSGSIECFELLLQFYTSPSQLRVFKRVKKLLSSSSPANNNNNDKNIFHYALWCKRIANKMIPFLLSTKISETIFIPTCCSTASAFATSNNNSVASVLFTVRSLLLSSDSTGCCPLEIALSKSLRIPEQNILSQMIVKVCGGLSEIFKNEMIVAVAVGSHSRTTEVDRDSSSSSLRRSFEKSTVGKKIIERKQDRQKQQRESSSSSSSSRCDLPLSSPFTPIHQRLVNYSITQQRTSLQNLFLSSELVKLNNAFTSDSNFSRRVARFISSTSGSCCSPLLCPNHIKRSVVSVSSSPNIDSVFTSWCNNNHNIHFMFETHHYRNRNHQSSSSEVHGNDEHIGLLINDEDEDLNENDESVDGMQQSSYSTTHDNHHYHSNDGKLSQKRQTQMKNEAYVAIIERRSEMLGADAAAQFASKSLTSPSLCKLLRKWLVYGLPQRSLSSSASSGKKSSSSFPSHLPLWLAWWLYYPIEGHHHGSCDYHTTKTILLRPGLTRESKTFLPSKMYAKHFNSVKAAFPLSGAGKVAHHFLKFAFTTASAGLTQREKISICFAVCWCYYVKHFECFGVNFASRYRSVSGDGGLIDYAVGVLGNELIEVVEQQRERRKNETNAVSIELNNDDENDHQNKRSDRYNATDANYNGVSTEKQHEKQKSSSSSSFLRGSFFILSFLRDHLGTKWFLPNSQSQPNNNNNNNNNVSLPGPITEKKLGQFLDMFFVAMTSGVGMSNYYPQFRDERLNFLPAIPHLIRLFPRIAARLFSSSSQQRQQQQTECVLFSQDVFLQALAHDVEFRKEVFASIDVDNYDGFMERLERMMTNSPADDENHATLRDRIFSFRSLLEAIEIPKSSSSSSSLVNNFFNDERFTIDLVNDPVIDEIEIKNRRNVKSFLMQRRDQQPLLFVSNVLLLDDELIDQKTNINNNNHDEINSFINRLPRTFDPSSFLQFDELNRSSSSPFLSLTEDEKHFVHEHLFAQGTFLAEKYALLDERFSRMAEVALKNVALKFRSGSCSLISLPSSSKNMITLLKPEHLNLLLQFQTTTNDITLEEQAKQLCKLLKYFSSSLSRSCQFSKLANENSSIIMKRLMSICGSSSNSSNSSSSSQRRELISKTLVEILLMRNDASLDWWKCVLSEIASAQNNNSSRNNELALMILSELLRDSKQFEEDAETQQDRHPAERTCVTKHKMIIREIELTAMKKKQENVVDQKAPSSTFIKPRPPPPSSSSTSSVMKNSSGNRPSSRQALNVVRSN